jgi:hypothetical protein
LYLRFLQRITSNINLNIAFSELYMLYFDYDYLCHKSGSSFQNAIRHRAALLDNGYFVLDDRESKLQNASSSSGSDCDVGDGILIKSCDFGHNGHHQHQYQNSQPHSSQHQTSRSQPPLHSLNQISFQLLRQRTKGAVLKPPQAFLRAQHGQNGHGEEETPPRAPTPALSTSHLDLNLTSLTTSTQYSVANDSSCKLFEWEHFYREEGQEKGHGGRGLPPTSRWFIISTANGTPPSTFLVLITHSSTVLMDSSAHTNSFCNNVQHFIRK